MILAQKQVELSSIDHSLMVAAGHQPNYLPWLGFFDKIRRSNIFIIEDNVQFERQGFTNRNRILTADGVRWLTVPIEHTDRDLLINEVHIANKADPSWRRKHWLTIKHSYCKALFGMTSLTSLSRPTSGNGICSLT
jgi:hypothetical protein